LADGAHDFSVMPVAEQAAFLNKQRPSQGADGGHLEMSISLEGERIGGRLINGGARTGKWEIRGPEGGRGANSGRFSQGPPTRSEIATAGCPTRKSSGGGGGNPRGGHFSSGRGAPPRCRWQGWKERGRGGGGVGGGFHGKRPDNILIRAGSVCSCREGEFCRVMFSRGQGGAGGRRPGGARKEGRDWPPTIVTRHPGFIWRAQRQVAAAPPTAGQGRSFRFFGREGVSDAAAPPCPFAHENLPATLKRHFTGGLLG